MTIAERDIAVKAEKGQKDNYHGQGTFHIQARAGS
jgi:hypothetical protein